MAAKKKPAAQQKTEKTPKYGELARELDEILGGIEEGEIDIDDLSAKVERATELIRQCREKLDATQIRVQKVVSTLGEEADENAEEEEDWEEEEAPF
ncbi:MAG: exodeoxyribonuclease VII small subunit [Planctomycetota bacterium]